VVRAVVQHVAALAKGAQVAPAVVGRVAVQMRGGEHHAGGAEPHRIDQIGPACGPAAPVAPGSHVGVEPAAVGQAAQPGEVRPGAALAAAAGALEAHAGAELAPVRRIERAQLGADRHGYRKPSPA